MRTEGNKLYFLLFLLIGVTIGSFLSQYVGQFQYFEWLSFGDSFGLKNPVVLDLFIVNITFGIKFELYIGSVIGLIIALVLYKKIM